MQGNQYCEYVPKCLELSQKEDIVPKRHQRHLIQDAVGHTKRHCSGHQCLRMQALYEWAHDAAHCHI